MVGVTVERTVLGWRVPRDVWERFEEFVAEKHGAKGPYLRFEVELAMREYLDDDELGKRAERLLKEHTDLRGLSSSTASVVSVCRYHGADTKKIGHRINAELKERFKIFADEHDADTYGRLLARALDSYADGGRARRILDDVERVITGGCTSDTTADSVENSENEQEGEFSTHQENDTSGITADAETALEIVGDLPDSDAVPARDIEEAIVRCTKATRPEEFEATQEAYWSPVVEQASLVEHPHKDDVYLTEEARENGLFWTDLEYEERLVLLRRFVAADAVEERKQHHQVDYNRVEELFEEETGVEPSDQYAYDLMKGAASEPGFSYGRYHGMYRLRVDLSKVDNQSILEYAFGDNPHVDPGDLAMDVDVTTYTAGSAPKQAGAADD